MKCSRLFCVNSLTNYIPLPVFVLSVMLIVVVQSFATVSIQSQVKLDGYDFFGKAVLDVIDQSESVTSYESDVYGYFNVQLSQPGQYDLNIRHNSNDFEWIQYFNLYLVEGVNTISVDPLLLNYNPDQTITVPTDRPTIQEALDAVQSGGWVIVTAQINPYEVNGLHWENKHVKLIGQQGAVLTLGYGSSAHAVYLSWSCVNRSDLIKGFEFQNCYVNTDDHYEAYGPALTLINGASPTVEDCSFLQNHVQNDDYDLEFNDPRGFGGAVFIDGGINQTQSPLFYNCLFTENNAFNANGGGAVALFGPGEFLNCTFTGNWTMTAVGDYVDAEFAAGAILIASDNHSGDIVIDNCTFINNIGQNEANDIWVAKCIGIDEIHISNCTFDQESVQLFSQPVIKIFSEFHTQNFPTEFNLYNNRFNLYERGAVYFYDILGTSPMWFYNNTIIGMDDALYGLYIYSRNQENALCFDNNTLRGLNDSGLVLFQGASYTLNNNLFDNCSPYDVQWGGSTGYYPTDSLTLNNCYFNDLTNHVDVTGSSNQTYVANDLLIASSPLLGTNHEPLWTSTVFSPVIDRGLSTMLDPDETPSDIGAIRAGDHQYEEYSMPYGTSSNIKWMSFPVLNNYTSGYTTNSNFFASIISTTVLDWVDWKDEDDPIIRMAYVSNTLQNGNNTVTSPVGYKVKLNSSVSSEIFIPTSGYIQSPTTTINLYKYLNGTTTINENWLGYFLPEPCNALEAFSPILSYITSITTQYWSATQVSPGVWWGNAGSRVLNPGDMVIVKVNQNCSFSWNNGQPVEPDYVQLAENFSYTEKADYTPLYIVFEEDFSPELPDEIGLYVNGVCKGATVVDGADAQICAYLDANEEITPENSELVFWYESKAAYQNRVRCNFRSDTLKKNQLEGHLYYSFKVDNKADTNTIVPITSLAQNYPNPFNPRTMIAFELAEEGPVSIEIYNVKGQKVTTLLSSSLVSGSHKIEWNGTDKYGRNVASGIYQYQLITKDKSISRKMLLMK